MRRANSFSQIDWNISKSNSLRFNFAVFPSKVRNRNLDTFNPPEVSPNYKQRGILASVSEQKVFRDGSFLSSEISYKTFDDYAGSQSRRLFRRHAAADCALAMARSLFLAPSEI